MEISLLRHLFQEGTLLSATVVPAPMEPGKWLMVFNKASGGQVRITKARTDIDKVYKRLNGALQDAQDIGFKEVIIQFD